MSAHGSRFLPPLLAIALLAVVLAAALGVVAPAPARATSADPAASSPVTGNITGPSLLATSGNATYLINGTGGPAIAANGTKVGNLTWHATITATNSTGIALTPTSGNLTGTSAAETNLSLSGVAQPVTIHVVVSSVYLKENESTNLSFTVTVVVPYVVTAEIVNGGSTRVLAFPVIIDLDQTAVGSVEVPALTPGAAYNLSFRYATAGLSVGDHTFSISLVNEHGLVRFANGESTYSTTFYVSAGPTNYTWWYVTGIVAFFAVLIIYGMRVAARRSGQLRK